MLETLSAVKELGIPSIVLAPNADAGGVNIYNAILDFKKENECSNWHVFTNLPTKLYYLHLQKVY